MIRITELQLPLDHPQEALREAILERLKIKEADLRKKNMTPKSNVQFGEGGAGLFSDGKLYSQIKDPKFYGQSGQGDLSQLLICIGVSVFADADSSAALYDFRFNRYTNPVTTRINAAPKSGR